MDSIPIGQLLPENSPAADCWEGKASFTSLVPRHFLDRDSFRDQAVLLDGRRFDRKRLAEILAAQNRAFSAGPRTMAQIEALQDPRAVVVVGGQQAGLFGGPLYTLYKALTVLALQARLEPVLKRPVVPVFWIASEDSDLAEVNHISFTGASGALVGVSLGGRTEDKLPVSRIPLGPGIRAALARLQGELPEGPLTDGLMSSLSRAYEPEATYPAAFGAWMQDCLKDLGLVLIDPSDTGLKQMAAGLFAREITEKGPVSRAVLRQAETLRARGYRLQIDLREDMLTLFSQDPAREAIAVADGGFQLKSTGRRATAKELLARLENDPGSFTPNAILRPLFQDTILPTLAVVLGPSELAYWAELPEAYKEMGLSMPVLFPRASFTLMEPKVERLMETHGISFNDIVMHREKILDVLAAREIPGSLTAHLRDAREKSRDIWAAVAEEAGAFEKTLKPTAENAARAFSFRLDRLEMKIVKAAKRKNDLLQNHCGRILASLWPDGGLQERSLVLPPFIARYGKGVIDLVFERMDPFAAEHRIVRIPS